MGQFGKRALADRLAELQHLLPEKVALHQEDQEDGLRLERDQVKVLQPRPGTMWSRHHRGVLGHGRDHHRDPLHECLAVRGGGPNLLRYVLRNLGRHRRRLHQEVDEVAVALIGGNPPGGCVRLDQVAKVAKVAELVADGRGAQVEEVPARQHLGPHRDGALGEFVDDRLQDGTLSRFH